MKTQKIMGLWLAVLLPGLALADGGKRVMGYYPSWTGVAPSKLRYENFTHIFHSFLNADEKGNLKKQDGLPSAELCRLAKARGVKVILSLGGAGSGPNFSALMRDPAAVDRYVANVVRVVEEAGYDGLDVDWEHPENAKDRADLIMLLGKFRKALRPGAILSKAVAAGDWAGKWLDASKMAKHLDFINIMSYDMHGPWSQHAGYVAPLYADHKDREHAQQLHYQAFLDYWAKVKKWPRNRINIGIPCYGYGFAVKDWYQAPSGKTPHSEGVGFRSIAGLLKSGWEHHWDDAAKVPFLRKKGGGELISYDDERSVKLKGEWARKQKLEGIFFWEITQDLVDGQNALVVAAREGFLGKP